MSITVTNKCILDKIRQQFRLEGTSEGYLVQLPSQNFHIQLQFQSQVQLQRALQESDLWTGKDRGILI